MGGGSAEVVRGDGGLLTCAEDACLKDDAFGGGVEAEAVAVRAESGAGSHDRVAAFAHLVAAGVGGDFGGGCRARIDGSGFRHGVGGWWEIRKKAAPVGRSACFLDSGDPV